MPGVAVSGCTGISVRRFHKLSRSFKGILVIDSLRLWCDDGWRDRTNDVPGSPSIGADARLRCVLVHGTFAPDADWVRPGSFLARGLQSLEEEGVRICSFGWSGRNSHADRTEAAQALASLLRLEALSNPDVRFLLVGHSHGGNIVMSAVKGIPESQRAGVVCLGTPFFHVRPRSTAGLMWIKAGLCAMVMGASFGLFFLALERLATWLLASWVGGFNDWLYSQFPLIESIGRTTGTAGAMVFLGVALVACVLFAILFSERAPPEGQSRALSRWHDMHPGDVPALCIWYAPDEAYWLLRLLWRSCEWIHMVVAAVFRYVMPALAVCTCAVALWMSWEKGLEVRADLSRMHAMSAIAWVIFSAGLIVVLMALSFWAVACLLSTLPAASLGVSSFWDVLWLEIRTERTPQVDEAFVKARLFSLHDGGYFESLKVALAPVTGSWVHSRAYIDSRTVQVIADWYKAMHSRLVKASARLPDGGAKPQPSAE